MERYLNPFKGRAVYTLRRFIEKSFVNNVEATLRCLLQLRARYGCTSLYKEGDDTEGDLTGRARGRAARITARTNGTVRGLTCSDATALVRVLLGMTGLQCPGTGSTVLDHAQFMVHTGAAVRGLKFDSRQTPNRTGSSRSFQNSFCRVPACTLVSVQVDTVGGLQPYPRVRARAPATNSIISGSVYVFIHNYVRVLVPGMAPGPGAGGVQVDTAPIPCDAADRVAARSADVHGDPLFAVVQVLQEARVVTFAGTPTVITQEPRNDLPFSSLYVAPVSAFQSQLLVLKAAGDVDVLRFVECPGKLDLDLL